MENNVKRIISQLVNNLGISKASKSIDEDSSWYFTYTDSQYCTTEIRLSNHKTDINTWIFREYRGVTPNKRISIVFRDGDYNGSCLAKEPTKKKIIVDEYVYDLRNGIIMSDRMISQITKAIRDIKTTNEYHDPLQSAQYTRIKETYVGMNTITNDNNRTTASATKGTYGADNIVDENKTTKDMKQTIRLNESKLRQLIKECLIKEWGFPEGMDVTDTSEIDELPMEYITRTLKEHDITLKTDLQPIPLFREIAEGIATLDRNDPDKPELYATLRGMVYQERKNITYEIDKLVTWVDKMCQKYPLQNI